LKQKAHNLLKWFSRVKTVIASTTNATCEKTGNVLISVRNRATIHPKAAEGDENKTLP